jgi:transposase
MLIGVDYHPSFQQIAFLVEETGECSERRLNHSDGEADKFYRDLQLRGVQVRVGMEATGYSRWFERLLAELGFEVWIGDPAEIKAKRVKKQKTDRQDAQLLLKLMRASPRWRWGAGWESACTGCGETAARIRRRWSSVRTRDSSVPDMV